MEYLSKIIEEAAKKVGTKKELALVLGMSATSLSDVLKGTRGLTPYAQDQLEKLMNLEGGALRAASELITEKDQEKKEHWKKKLEALAACLVLGVVTNFVTPAPCEAAPVLSKISGTLYIMSNLRRKAALLKQRFLQALQVTIPEALRRFLVPRVHHVTA